MHYWGTGPGTGLGRDWGGPRFQDHRQPGTVGPDTAPRTNAAVLYGAVEGRRILFLVGIYGGRVLSLVRKSRTKPYSANACCSGHQVIWTVKTGDSSLHDRPQFHWCDAIREFLHHWSDRRQLFFVTACCFCTTSRTGLLQGMVCWGWF